MKKGIFCIGEALVDFVAMGKSGRLLEAEAFKPCAGGAPANVAVAIARLGGDAGLVSCVGEDVWGDFLCEVFEREGVDVRGIQRTDRASTTQAFVSLDEDGDRDFSFVRCPGADTLLDGTRLESDCFDSCSILHFGTFSLSSEPSRAATLEAIRRVKEAAGLISLDVNYREGIWASEDEAIRWVESILPLVDILKVSLEELRLLTGMEDRRAAVKRLMGKGPRIALVSLDSEGCLCANHLARFDVSAFPARCVDATGAGDSFMGAFLHRFVELEFPFDDVDKLEDACTFACAAASVTVSGYGAIPSLPTREEVLAKLSSELVDL
ncbi:carbohydrate kinase [Pelagicoccus sp. SDUM812005]|uniref:carbohydrate kinase family protein n=1 Tax=Pelagicoccus sp. SDUM812005 TaxID=3041257 RepID=UPI00280CBE49|nr:carbohydrate kinase [Pelagicoccus sp. SDUM812005]MDQ8180412.1 carbohydrate kinase [Pelagicoccus sp. SDUM812005]